MEYLYWDLGQQPAGRVVQVSLDGNAANVFLVDSINYDAYRAGRAYRYFGGVARQSPVRLAVPYPGHWYAVVDMRGLGGQVQAAVELL